MSYIDSRIIVLTSQSATIKKNGSFLSNLRYEFGYIFKDDPDIIHRQIQLLNAQIPYSFYIINYTNNLFRYDLGTGILTKTIAVGNYTSTSLINAIKVLVNDANFNISLSAITGILTFSYNTNFTIYNDFTASIGNILGFSSNTVNFSASNIIIAPHLLNLLGIKTLEIRSNNLIMNNISSVQGGNTTLLSSIPVSCVPFGMIEYKDKGNNLITIYNSSLDDLDVEIVDAENAEYINFNNANFTLTIVIHLTRSREPRFPYDPSFSNPLGTFSKNSNNKENKDLNELNTLLN